MLGGKGDYHIERWFAGGVPLATVRSPAARCPLPAVVIFHGFDGNKTDDLLRIALPLADEDFVAVMPGAALHGERAPDSLFLDSLRGPIEEAEGVLSWTADREDVDETRIGAVGISMGGAVTLALSCRELPLAPKVAVALMPFAPGSPAKREAAYAPDPAACFPTALLMMHGTDDRVAPYPNARSFYDALVPRYSAAPERPRFVDVPGEGNRVGAYWIEETLAWLGKYL